MHPDLQRTLDALRAATAKLDAETLARRPPGKWSGAQILEHLAKSYAGTAYILGRCLEQGQPKARRATLGDRLSSFVVVDLGYLPEGRQAPQVALPSESPPADIADAAGKALVALDEAAARAEARFGRRTKVANHPILGPFSVRQWRRFHLVHTRHHIKQLERLRRA